MRQVLKENEKYVRLEPTLSKPSAASTDAESSCARWRPRPRRG
jgi:hypothetical protein